MFTDTPYAGNTLAVVLGTDGLDTARMHAIARAFNLSETIFVMAPRDPAKTARVQLFFPAAEILFAGHPTLACAALLAEMLHGTGEFDARIVLEEEAGLVPATVKRRAGLTWGEFAAPVRPGPADGDAQPALIARALCMTEAAIGFGAHAPALFKGGPSFLFVALADLEVLALASPIEPHWSELMAAGNVDSAYLYSPGATEDFRARMLSPTAGIPEDPATGSASAMLAVQQLRVGALAEGENRFHLIQGAKMGRPSRIGLTVDVQDGALAAARISGAADGMLQPPARHALRAGLGNTDRVFAGFRAVDANFFAMLPLLGYA